MTVLRYPVTALALDLLRGAGGLAVVVAPLALAQPPPWLALVLLALAGLFLVFLVLTGRRLRQGFVVDAAGIAAWPAGPRLRWDGLQALTLRYYSTRRDRARGWMELELAGDGLVLRLDSRLRGFDGVLARSTRAAADRGLSLSAATRANIQAAGLESVDAGEVRV